MNDLDLIEMRMIEQARANFWCYRQYINPKMKQGWWQREIAYELQWFYIELVSGLKPKLVIEAPPQHGKSIQVVDWVSWVAGHNPEFKTIYASFSDRLGIRANLRLQRIYDSEVYQKIFPNTTINKSNSVTISSQNLRNREILEYVGTEGYFRNTTVNGSITGESLDIGVMDDPIKGREQAGSETIRDKTWDWFVDDFFTRFSEDAGFLAILTRWHLDDPIGRFVTEFPGVRVLKYPAIATKDEKYRNVGEPLFPQHKSLEFLLERKKLMASSSWESLYQQNPIAEGGELIKGAYFVLYDKPPIIKYRFIYADTAMKTKEHNDYSVFQCWGRGEDGKIYLLDQIRGKWEAPELKRRALAFWNKHKDPVVYEKCYFGQLRGMKVEDKSSGTGLIQDLKLSGHIPIKGIERNTDKLTRVSDVLSYLESQYVCIPAEAPWLNDFIKECEAFTADDTHQHDDQIDPMIDAIDDLLARGNKLRVWENII